MISQDIKKFQRSITEELHITKDRVRNLIGAANWPEDGRYKEAILRKSISQFLPANLSMGTGFILSNEDHINGTEGRISSQLDIIIYDNRFPVIFKEGDFVILTENAARGVIEVKTSITNYSANHPNALNNIILKINRLKEFSSFHLQERKKFVGVFCYEYEEDFLSASIDDALRESDGFVNHISLGQNDFIRYWDTTAGLSPHPGFEGRCYNRYELKKLSFSYFISNLLHIVSDDDPVERYWFSFPLEGTKERFRVGEILRLP